MSAFNLSPAEVAALRSSPALLVQAINDALDQARFLAEQYHAITGESLGLSLPDDVTEPDAIGDPGGGPAYKPNGLTDLRTDGTVRSKAWDAAIAAALASDDPVQQAWGAQRAVQPWIYIQDALTLPGVTEAQRRAIGVNCSNARFLNGLTGGSPKGFAYPAYSVRVDDGGIARLGDEIPDAFAINDDLVSLTGEVMAKGYWAKDLASLAERSLAHFVRTSGRSVLLALKG